MAIDPEHLNVIQQHFHELIKSRAGELFSLKIGDGLPSLNQLQPGDEPVYFPVEGMYGGFSYRLSASGAEPTLIVEAGRGSLTARASITRSPRTAAN